MAFCSKCGAPLQENAASCPNCGAVIYQYMNGETQQQTPVQPETLGNTDNVYYQPPQQNDGQIPAYTQQAPYTQPQPPYAQQNQGYAQPPYAPQPPYYNQQQSNDVSTARTLGIVAIILAFFSPLFCWICGGIGLSKANNAILFAQQTGNFELLSNAESAKKLNKIGIILSLVLFAVALIGVIAFTGLGIFAVSDF